MILEIVFTAIILLITYIYVEWILKTKKLMDRYKRDFEAKGFKVEMLPYTISSGTFLDKILQYMKNTGQSNEYQKHGINSDVLIASVIIKTQVHIIHPEICKEFYTTAQRHYNKPRKLLGNFIRGTGEGLIFSEGNLWKRKRKILSNIFHFQFIQSLGNTMAKITNQVFDEFDQSHLEQINKMYILEEFKKITSKLLLKSFFGFKIDDIKLEGIPIGLYFVDLLDKLTVQTLHPISVIFGDKFFKLGLRQLDRDINRMIKTYKEFILMYIKSSYQEFKQREKNGLIKQSSIDKNILEELFRTGTIKDSSNDSLINSSSDDFDFSQLMAEFGNFMTGGIDTTSILCTNIIINLNNHPHVLQKLKMEIAKYIHEEEDYNSDNLKNMKYLQAIINESLRMDPPLSSIVGRQALYDTELAKVRIEKGTFVIVQILSNQFNREYFSNPDEFLPERWLDEKCGEEPFTYTPFSAGPRNCIGQHLALLQTKIIILKFVKRYNFTIKDPIRRYVSLAVTPQKFDTYVEKNSS